MGNDIRLGPILERHHSLIVEWVNDPARTAYMATGRRPLSTAEALAVWGPRDDAATFMIEIYDQLLMSLTGRPWQARGVCGLYGLDFISGKAELRILIGVPLPGLGTMACRRLLEIAFVSLRLERVWLGTAAGNMAARRCFEKAGFQEEGVKRRDLYRDGVWHDNVMMAVLRSSAMNGRSPRELDGRGVREGDQRQSGDPHGL